MSMNARMTILCEVKDLLMDTRDACRLQAIILTGDGLDSELPKIVTAFEERLATLWDLQEELLHAQKD